MKDIYRKGVETFFNLKSDTVFSNGNPEHAAIIYEMFFKKAAYCVHIYCKNLCRLVFDHDFVIDAMKAAVSRGIELKIYITDSKPESTLFYQALQACGVEVHCNSKVIELNGSPCNFAYMDDVAFRFEENADECKAFASANQPKFVRTLSKKFKDIIKHAA